MGGEKSYCALVRNYDNVCKLDDHVKTVDVTVFLACLKRDWFYRFNILQVQYFVWLFPNVRKKNPSSAYKQHWNFNIMAQTSAIWANSNFHSRSLISVQADHWRRHTWLLLSFFSSRERSPIASSSLPSFFYATSQTTSASVCSYLHHSFSLSFLFCLPTLIPVPISSFPLSSCLLNLLQFASFLWIKWFLFLWYCS